MKELLHDDDMREEGREEGLERGESRGTGGRTQMWNRAGDHTGT